MSIRKKIEALRVADRQAEAEITQLRSQIESLNNEISTLLNNSFASELETKIRNTYTHLNAVLNDLMATQAKLNVADTFLYKTYANPMISGINERSLVEDFAKAYRTVADGLAAISNDHNYKYENPNFPKYAKEIAKSFAYIKLANQSASRLAKMYSDLKILPEVEKKRAIVKQLQQKVQTREKELRAELTSQLNEIKETLAALQKLSSQATLSPETTVTNDFSQDYYLCIGKNAHPNTRTTLNLHTLKRTEKFDLGGPVFLKGFDASIPNNIIIDEAKNPSLVDQFLENLLLSFLASYPSKFKNICFMHPVAGSKYSTIMSKIKACDSQGAFLFQKGSAAIESDNTKIRNALETAIAKTNETSMLLGTSDCPNIYEYNHKQPGNAQPITLLIVKDYPNGFSQDITPSLKNIFEQGNTVGIITVIIYNSANITSNNSEVLDFLLNAQCAYRLQADTDALISEDKSQYIMPITRSADFNLNRYFAMLSENLKKENRPIFIQDVWSQEDFQTSDRRKNYAKALDIPVGKVGSTITNIRLGTDKKPNIIANGGVGSGKTAFLHTLILSAAYHYSPEELEINLFDFKDGAGFNVYKYKQLPHVKFISLENKVDDAQEILMYLSSQMTARYNALKAIPNVSTFYGYNTHPDVLSGKYPKLSRMMIIIDEYHALMDSPSSLGTLENIARKGRDAGMSLVLVSQDVPTDVSFNTTKQLMEHRLAFRGTPQNVGAIIEGAEKRTKDLELQVGLCFYRDDESGTFALMRIAFAGDNEELAKNVDHIAQKYPNAKRNMKIVGAPSKLRLSDVSTVPRKPKNAILDDIEKYGRYSMTFGEYNITNRPADYYLDEDKNLLLVFGDYIHAKQIEGVLLSEIIKTHRLLGETDELIFFLDMTKSIRQLRRDNPVKQLREEKEKLLEEGDETFSTVSFYDNTMYDDVLNKVSNLLMNRKSNLGEIPSPAILVISNASELSDSHDLNTLKDIIEEGRSSGIYVVLQMTTPECPCYNYLFKYGERSADFIIMGPQDEEDTAANVITVLNKIQNSILNINPNAYTQSLAKNSLHPAFALICNNGILNKFFYYQLEDGWIDSLKNYLS